MMPRGLKILWWILYPVQNNSWLDLICPSSRKTKCPFCVVELTMDTICILQYMFTYYIMMMSLFTLSLPSSLLLSSDLCPGVALPITDERFIYWTALCCTIPCHSEFILRWAAFGTKAAWSQFVSVLGSYISPKLSASPSGTQLFMELTIWDSMSCYECHYYNKSLTFLDSKATGVLVGQKTH